MRRANHILNILNFSAKLKKQERTIKLSRNRNESVADHSWHLVLMVLLVAPHLKDKIDLLKALKMALIHDLVEAEIGDTPYYADKEWEERKKEKYKKEKNEILKIKKIIGGLTGKEFYDLWHDFEKGKTVEAKFIAALDSLEANYQSILYDVDYWDDWFYGIALTKAEKFCKHEKILSELNQEITKKMKKEFKKIGLDIAKLKRKK